MTQFTKEDKDNLKGVLDATEDVLGKCSEPWADLIFPEPLRTDIKNAWPVVKERIQKLRQDIDMDQGTLAPKFEEAGLTGKPLKAKTTGLFGWVSKFKRLGSTRFLKNVLEWLNILLGSIPGAELIKEHKEVVEKAIKDGESGEFEAAPTLLPQD